MSIEYRLDGPIAVVTPHGINALEDVRLIFEALLADPDLVYPARILFDARRTDYGPPSEELEALSEYLAGIEAFRKGWWAIVANPNSLVYGLTRMFCYLAESQGICAEPFADFEKARQWLLNPQVPNGTVDVPQK